MLLVIAQRIIISFAQQNNVISKNGKFHILRNTVTPLHVTHAVAEAYPLSYKYIA